MPSWPGVANPAVSRHCSGMHRKTVERLSEATDLLRQGRVEAAEAACRAVLRREPGEVEVLALLGAALNARQDFAAALPVLEQALARRPGHIAAAHNRGVALLWLGRPEAALAALDTLLAARPDLPMAWCDRGNALAEMDRQEAAVAAFDRALALAPGAVEPQVNRGLALIRLGRPEAALASFDRALAAAPGNPGLLANRAMTLALLGRQAEALVAWQGVLTANPASEPARAGRARALLALRRPAEALALLEGLPDMVHERALALSALHRSEEAIACFDAVLAADPDNADARWDRAFALFRAGRLEAGFADAQARWLRLVAPAQPLRQFAAPPWLGGGEVAGQRVLVCWEQGFGDTLQFVRYVPLLARRGALVHLLVQPALARLLAGLEGLAGLHVEGEALPEFDLWCPVMSLPLAFGTGLDTVPADIPYLRPPAERLAAWAARLGPRPGRRVGLAWVGSPTNANDAQRSIPWPGFAGLLEVPGCTFAVLHAAPEPALAGHPAVVWPGGGFTDFADTAALIAGLDLVVTVDTAIAHLAGALGVPVWILLPQAPDWRWMLERSDSPWYPTARLFRQTEPDAWGPVLDAVAAALAAI